MRNKASREHLDRIFVEQRHRITELRELVKQLEAQRDCYKGFALGVGLPENMAEQLVTLGPVAATRCGECYRTELVDGEHQAEQLDQADEFEEQLDLLVPVDLSGAH